MKVENLEQTFIYFPLFSEAMESNKSGSLQPNDLLAIIVIVVGSVGFLLWGLGISSLGNQTLRWLGSVIVALVGLLIALLERWLK